MTRRQEVGYYPLEHGPREGESIVMLHGGNMAGWTWDLQVQALPHVHILTPDLPGYGRYANEIWPGSPIAADRIADLIHRRALGGRAHIVGLSLGGFVATEILRRHPECVHSCIMSGSMLAGTSGFFRAVIAAQVPFWTQRWYWQLQALSFGIPSEDRERFIYTSSAPLSQSNWAMARETTTGICPLEGLRFDGPVLAVTAEHDLPGIQKGYEVLKEHIPHLQTWTAPGVHHPWSVENPELFAQMVSSFVEIGRWPR